LRDEEGTRHIRDASGRVHNRAILTRLREHDCFRHWSAAYEGGVAGYKLNPVAIDDTGFESQVHLAPGAGDLAKGISGVAMVEYDNRSTVRRCGRHDGERNGGNSRSGAANLAKRHALPPY